MWEIVSRRKVIFIFLVYKSFVGIFFLVFFDLIGLFCWVWFFGEKWRRFVLVWKRGLLVFGEEEICFLEVEVCFYRRGIRRGRCRSSEVKFFC